MVRKVTAMEYELIAGERRLRACVMCGKTKIPCIVITCNDDEAKVFSLEENIQRTDLNFIEEAQGVCSYITSENISQNQAAAQLGKQPEEISDMMDILKLDESERELVLKNHLSIRHAKALLRIEDKKTRNIWTAVICLAFFAFFALFLRSAYNTDIRILPYYNWIFQ